MARRRQRVVHAVAVLMLGMLGAALGAGDDMGVAVAAAPPRISLERVTLTAPAIQVPQLQALGLDVAEDVTATAATVVAGSDRERRVLRDAGFATRTLISDYGALRRARQGADLRAVLAATPSALPSGRIAYRTAAEVQADLDTLEAGHPGLVRRVVLPRRSVEGRQITGVEIATNVNRADDGRPVYVVMGETHAREWPSAEISVEFALDLVAHQSDPRIAGLLAGLRIIVIPVVNPDAYAYSRGTAADGQPDPLAATKRRNCRALAGDSGTSCAGHRGVDLNRNYGAFWGGLGASTSHDADTYRGSRPWSEPESAAVHEFTAGLPVTGVQSLHNVAALVLRPPGFRALGLAPDEGRLKALGDAMAAATGYDSRYGYELYEVTGAAEDWNYVAQGAFGYTIELGGAFPGDPDFQGTYQTHVVDQYLGRAGTSSAGKGVREALLLAAEEAMNTRDHAVVRGHAQPGTVLTLSKSFSTTTSPVCSDTLAADACGPTTPALSLPDALRIHLTVGDDGTFAWQTGPSTRPFFREQGRHETWTLSCDRSTTVVKSVFADRGQVVDVDPCDANSLPRAGAAGKAPAVKRVSATMQGITRQALRRGGRVLVTLRCPVTACRADVRITGGTVTVAKRDAIALAKDGSVTVAVPMTSLAPTLLKLRYVPRRLSAQITFRTTTGNAATVKRSSTIAAH